MYGDYYGFDTSSEMENLMGEFSVVTWLIVLAVSVFTIICMWKILKKAGKQGWECLIPIYSNIVMLEIAGLPTWYLILYFIPIANIYISFKLYVELAHKFGKSTGFGVGMALIPVVFNAILAFDDSAYLNATKESTNINTGFCPSCGSKLDEDSIFCPNCGNKVK